MASQVIIGWTIVSQTIIDQIIINKTFILIQIFFGLSTIIDTISNIVLGNFLITSNPKHNLLNKSHIHI